MAVKSKKDKPERSAPKASAGRTSRRRAAPGKATGARKAAAAKPRNADKTKALILEKATGLFAERGYAGTPLSEIVDASGVNKRMVYHYFGDKDGLYRAVFRQQWTELKDWVESSLQERFEAYDGREIASAELLAETVTIASEFMAGNRNFIRLMMWDGLEGGAVSRALWKDTRGPLFVQLEFLIRQAQLEGMIDPALDRAQLILTFLGAISFYFGFASTLEDIIHADPFSARALEARKKHMIQIIRLLAPRTPASLGDTSGP